MKVMNYFLEGLGFVDIADFKKSAFGHMISEKVIASASILGFLATVADYIEVIFGINHAFFTAYVVLILFEWLTGIMASRKRKELHSSRKLGRMLLKIGAYSIPIYILNTMAVNIAFPVMFGFPVNPFLWLYYAVLIIIIWQLVVSLLENLVVLNVRYARVALKIINKKFYENLGVDNE